MERSQTPDGVSAFEGDEAERKAQHHRAQASGLDDLEAIAAEIVEGRKDLGPRLSEERYLNQAIALQDSDPAAFGKLRAALKEARFPVGVWEGLVKAQRRKLELDRKTQRVRDAERSKQEQRERYDQAREEFRARTIKENPALAAHFHELEADGRHYSVVPGLTTVHTTKSSGRGTETQTETLAHFSVHIARTVEVIASPGAKPVRSFELSVVTEGSKAPREEIVPAERFDRLEWLPRVVGAAASVSPESGARGRLAQCIALASRSSPVAQHFGFTGWVDTEAGPTYLHGGGAINAHGVAKGAETQLHEGLRKFTLPPPGSTDDVRAALEFLSLEPAHLAVPLVGAVFRSLLGWSPVTIHVSGAPEAGKTYFASFAAQFFGAGMDHDNPPASWTSKKQTALGLDYLMSHCGDAVLWVDDLKRSGVARDDEATSARFQSVVCSKFDRQASLRLQRHGPLREGDGLDRTGVLISTGELLPRGFSTNTRMLNLVLERPVAGLERFRSLAARGVLAACTARFVQWLAPKLRARQLDLPVEVEKLRPRLGDRPRPARLAAELAMGVGFFLEFCGNLGVVTPSEAEAQWDRVVAALRFVASAQDGVVAEENPATKFINALRAMLSQGEAHASCTQHGKEPRISAHLGWHAGNPRGRALGYVPPEGPMHENVFLLPRETVQTVLAWSERQGQGIAADPNAVAKALRDHGHLSRTDGANLAVQVRVLGVKGRYYLLKLSSLIGETEDGQASLPV